MLSRRLARLFGHQDRCLSALHYMLGPAHRVCRVRPNHLAGDQPIEEHPYGSQVLFDCRLRERMPELLDVESHVDRLDPLQPPDPSLLAPGEKLPDVVVVGDTGVFVANRCGEEFQKTPRSVLAGVGYERRNDGFRGCWGDRPGRLIGDELAHRLSVT